MALKFYNTLSRKIEPFVPLQEGKVSLYSCGPTVHNYVHIGNWRAVIFFDLLKRYLTYRGYQVQHVMNITDVDDKTIKGCIKAGKSLREFTDYYTQEFLKEMQILQVATPNLLPRASDEIECMVEMIERLLANGNAYKNEKGDVYFKIASFPNYGQLAQLDGQLLKSNADGRMNQADEYDKEDVRDFALWKAWDEEDGDAYWETSLGKGRPGWSIECSAMATKYLGKTIDIHLGGVDLIFPHHTNEIAQSECACGQTFSRFWMHNGHLKVNGMKMAKSSGNFFTLGDLLDKGYDALAIRYELIKTHYRATSDFREDSFDSAFTIIRRIQDLFDELGNIKDAGQLNSDNQVTDSQLIAKAIETCRKQFVEAMDDDLNISVGIAALLEFISSANKELKNLSKHDAEQAVNFLIEMDSVLGFVKPRVQQDIPEEVLELQRQRDLARQNKNFQLSDELRQQILDKGYLVKDEAGSSKLVRV